MNYSQKILNLSDLPKFRSDSVYSNSVTIQLSHSKAKIRISFEVIIISDEVCFDRIAYQTNLLGPYLGLLDGFVELMHKRPLEAIDRFPAKELDYYLRDNASVPSISGLDEKFYEILGLGEEIKKSYFEIDKDYSPKLSRAFKALSLSEQLEFIEEIFSYYIYNKDHEFKDLEITDIEDENVMTLYFDNSGGTAVNTEKLQKFLSDKLKLDVSIRLND